ncbi:Z1 domain-containing protein [Ruoffia tabacinasalis]|uniref:Z1 domain-containing protein n=1 Tax=Ruoffia tabacinasalis TaxID=87458 RepID=A0ABS0LHM4_9LACT|nr:Z1 domain-containing protein [Ruoffia tabacinasalis]MBG9977795.1 Z1 domain-containing protein [Ruoffia tabacinasalis]
MINNSNIENLETYIDTGISVAKSNDESVVIDEYRINELADLYSKFIPDITDEEKNKAIINIQQKVDIVMDKGVTLRDKDTYKKWYEAALAERGNDYWDRYKRYLKKQKLPTNVIDNIDDISMQIMDSLADPLSEEAFNRKGLVIGSVQSGKTSNYIALMNKAMDSGYKVFIILTGTIEKLRVQTQSRVDEGFIGKDSSQTQKIVGVGLEKELDLIPAFTSTDNDFSSRDRVPLYQDVASVFVIKKNKHVLEKLGSWLKNNNTNGETSKIELPLLLIDDEADNASINTSQDSDDPTTINKSIRKILKLFSKSSYVGFTATPFANIFINPQLDEEEKDDLFPRDFITLLEQPSNYVGPYDMYMENGKYNYMIRYNDDLEELLPLKHSKTDYLSHLPKSLQDSIITFFLANAIRDLRLDNKKHRSMLIHISRFIDVQNYARGTISNYVKTLQTEIKHYILSDGSERPTISRIKKVFENEFKNKQLDDSVFPIKESWDEVRGVLYESVRNIQIRVVNSGTAAQNLNYEDYPNGLRIIAIGGLSLARGLTLEGLMTSYFYRNTKMYDTLMQMGRWFGYRDGYQDLCRLWTSEESEGWYAHIAEATQQLGLDIRRMHAQRKRPIEFGLRVLSSQDMPLIVTALNKKRSSKKAKIYRELNGTIMETTLLEKYPDKLEANNLSITSWLESNLKYLVKDESILQSKAPTFKDVPKSEIENLLVSTSFPRINGHEEAIQELLTQNNPILDYWDVVIATQIKDRNLDFGPIKINPHRRSFDLFGDKNNYIRMNRSKKRLGTVAYSYAGLTKEEYKKIKISVDDQRKLLGKTKSGSLKAASDYMYFNSGIKRNPQIVIYPIKLKNADSDRVDHKEINEYVKENQNLATGISIGIPEINNSNNIRYEYEINDIYQRELLGIPLDSDEPDDEDDEFLLNWN